MSKLLGILGAIAFVVGLPIWIGMVRVWLSQSAQAKVAAEEQPAGEQGE